MASLTKDEITKLKLYFDRWKVLDQKKLEFPLSKYEEAEWSDLLLYITEKLYKKKFTTLLDQRDFLRVPLNLNVQYTYDDQDFDANTIDIGIYGCCLLHNAALRTGSMIKLFFPFSKKNSFLKFLNKYRKIKIEGRVNWMNPILNTMGIEFFNLTSNDKKYLQDLIYRYLSEIIDKITS